MSLGKEKGGLVREAQSASPQSFFISFPSKGLVRRDFSCLPARSLANSLARERSIFHSAVLFISAAHSFGRAIEIKGGIKVERERGSEREGTFLFISLFLAPIMLSFFFSAAIPLGRR